MRWFRGLGRVLGCFLLVALLIPSLAAWPSSFLDRGADGSARISVFPLALTLFDPFVWTCARNSAVMAALVASGSLVIGVGLALIAGRWRFWGRAPLWALAMVAPLAAGPLLIAPGVLLSLGGPEGWEWLAARSILGFSWENLVRWASLIWVGLASGVPLVALSTTATLRHVEPSWAEAARAIGASRWRIWREIVWPILRPRAARAASAVFTLALIEPAGPLVLGLRRTLAAQILATANRLEQPTRAATLAVLAIAIAGVGRVAIGWWGGVIEFRIEPSEVISTNQAGFRRAWLSRLILLGWSFFAVGPIGLLFLRGWQAGLAASQGPWFAPILGWLADPEAQTWLANSATTAGLAVAIELLILAALLRRTTGPSLQVICLTGRLFESIPPLALGVGALASPWLVAVLADSFDGPVGRWLRSIALELSPGRSPGFLLILALAAGHLSMMARASLLARRSIRSVRVDAARLIGVSDRRAFRAGEAGWVGVVPVSSLILALALALTNLTPALLLTPFSERRTVAPAALKILLEPESIDPRVFGPMMAIFVVNMLGFALASRSRDGSIGEWFQGR